MRKSYILSFSPSPFCPGFYYCSPGKLTNDIDCAYKFRSINSLNRQVGKIMVGLFINPVPYTISLK